LFDAVSALCGVRHASSYDGQAAIELEWLASRAPAADDSRVYPYELGAPSESGARQLDTRPLIVALVSELRRGVAPARVARRFHATLAALILDVCLALRAEHGLTQVALSGGVFANALLVTGVEKRLRAAKFQVFRPQRYPPGDGGLCLGQLGIAAARETGAS
jgi:hydrogenase maturation protein HypF